MNITETLEDYLEAVFRLGKGCKPVRVKQIADLLEVKKTTVVASLKKLKQEDLVEQEHYGYIYLTEKGEKEARRIYNRHAVLKKFLIRVLNVEREQAEAEACKMEHILSEDTIRKMDLFTQQTEKQETKVEDHS